PADGAATWYRLTPLGPERIALEIVGLFPPEAAGRRRARGARPGDAAGRAPGGHGGLRARAGGAAIARRRARPALAAGSRRRPLPGMGGRLTRGDERVDEDPHRGGAGVFLGHPGGGGVAAAGLGQ